MLERKPRTKARCAKGVNVFVSQVHRIMLIQASIARLFRTVVTPRFSLSLGYRGGLVGWDRLFVHGYGRLSSLGRRPG
jgi:hypothetical protein